MGQEITYCYWCSTRILGADFDRGAAVLIGNHACCAACLHKVLASLPDGERSAVLNQMNRSAPGPSRSATRMTPRGGTPALPPAPVPSRKPLVLLGAAVAVLAVAAVVAMSSSGRPEEREPARTPALATATPPKPERSDKEKSADAAIAKAREAGGSKVDLDTQVRLWDEAVWAADKTPRGEEAMKERAAALDRRREAYALELKQLTESIDGIVRGEEFKKALDLLASARKRHDFPDWTLPIDRKTDDVKKLEAGAGPFRQSGDADGLVVIEAEHFNAKVDRDKHTWTVVNAPPGFSGPGAVAALPNDGLVILKDWAALAPRLDYKIQFAKAGKHYVWVRAFAESDADNSVHLGLDGAEMKSLSHIGFSASRKWAWTNKMMDGTPANFTVDAPGVRVLNLWMREDGAVVDRIILTVNPKWGPKDAGPAESPR